VILVPATATGNRTPSAAAHKLHSTPQQDRMNLISGNLETRSRLSVFSLFLPGSCPINRDRRTARDTGFASLWFPHHWLTHPMQMLQITRVMGYVAAHAQGMTIGPNILILPPLNPMHVAEEAATLDVLTGGNYILGVGLGYRQPEFDAFGIRRRELAQ
jgi:hypothetical protein